MDIRKASDLTLLAMKEEDSSGVRKIWKKFVGSSASSLSLCGTAFRPFRLLVSGPATVHAPLTRCVNKAMLIIKVSDIYTVSFGAFAQTENQSTMWLGGVGGMSRISSSRFPIFTELRSCEYTSRLWQRAQMRKTNPQRR